jgi:hypothetical protein
MTDPVMLVDDERLREIRERIADVQARLKAGGYADLDPGDRARLEKLLDEAAGAIDDYFALVAAGKDDGVFHRLQID